MRIFLTSLLTLVISVRTMAQNESLLPLFDQAKSYYCPALTGDKGKASAYLMGGYQYFGYYERSAIYTKGLSSYHNKRSLNLNLSGPIYQKGKHRISLGAFSSWQHTNVLDPEIAFKSDLRLSIAYSYNCNVGTFAIGVNGDFIQIKSVLGVFPNRYSVSGRLYNAGGGVAFRSKNDRFYVGAAVNNLYDQTLQTNYKNTTYYYFETSKDFYLNSGLDIPINLKLLLTPSINIWYSGRTIVASNIMMEYKKKYICGLQYINNGSETGGFRIGYKTGSINFHYSYGLYISRLVKVSNSQHTFGIVYTPKRTI